MDRRQFSANSERRKKLLGSQVKIGGLRINGLDYLEVLDDDAPSEPLRQRLLDVVFLRPDGVAALGEENFAIEGGVRIVGIEVVAAAPGANAQTVRLTLDRAGDFSRYRLVLRGSSLDAPPASFDPALALIEFSFKADCPTDFDALPPPAPLPEPPPAPPIDYLAKDYESFRRLMIDRMAVTMPGWTERRAADLGVTLVETLAFGADLASYYQDAVGTEAYLSRARLRASARRHARLLGYRAGESCNARTFVCITVNADRTQLDPPLVPAGTMLLTHPDGASGGGLAKALPRDPERVAEALNAGARVFETMADVTALYRAQNELTLHSWSASAGRLPAGATTAHLVGTLANTHLEAGDVLVFEERFPIGGTASDPADPTHRHAVRLDRSPRELSDPLEGKQVLEIHWALADALPFALNLGSDGAQPGAVARGNIVLADDGHTLDYAYANLAPEAEARQSLHAGLVGRSALDPEMPPEPDSRGYGAPPYRPRVTVGPLTRAVPFDAAAARRRPAAEALQQDAAAALPAIELSAGETWLASTDLLNSDRFAAEFVVETGNDGSAELRFGDNRFGATPQPGVRYRARLRVGTGAAGRLGADALGHIVLDDAGYIDDIRNPLPAVGGAEPETLTAIKLAAPRAFHQQRRAVTAEDYAGFAERHPDVQRAIAERRWTGSWQTMFIAVDRRGGRPVDAAFEAELIGFLEPFRLAGHDLEIEPPVFVPLDVALVVCAADGHYAEHVEAALLSRFSSGIRPDRTRGYFHPDAFSFGEDVLLSSIIAEAMAVPGVRWVGMQLPGSSASGRFRRFYDQGVDYAEDGIIAIGRREVARLDNDPDAPEHGRLRFYVEGGR
ncbi:putative baseplate assembly protein [Devosia sp.]|uniref:putative baseplate assembly protein n=1 Tax=Devosia sp. TaxID=1871048 RepID=UPI003F6FC29D